MGVEIIKDGIVSEKPEESKLVSGDAQQAAINNLVLSNESLGDQVRTSMLMRVLSNQDSIMKLLKSLSKD